MYNGRQIKGTCHYKIFFNNKVIFFPFLANRPDPADGWSLHLQRRDHHACLQEVNYFSPFYTNPSFPSWYLCTVL